MKKFKVEVIADSSGEWVGNGLKFATREEAQHYGEDLFSRWTAVREWRIVESEEFEEGACCALSDAPVLNV